ncbi:MAG: ABC transporter substrate-binding protein [Marinomonadaceae bacterium]
MKKVILTLSLLSSLTLTQAHAEDLRHIRIGVEGAYPPFSWTTPDGQLDGFDIDIAKALCEEMHAECVLISQNWDGMIPALITRKFDAIIASMSITEERKKKVAFTNKYYQISARFVTTKNNNIVFTPEGLKGKTIGVQRSSTYDKYISEKYSQAEIKRYSSQDEAFLDMRAGRVDLVISNIPSLKEGLLEKKGGEKFEMVGPVINDKEWFGEGVGIAVRKNDNDLRKIFNKAIKGIRSKGVYQEIQNKYFDFDIYGG